MSAITGESPLIQLGRAGQSVWLDNLSRNLINSGELNRLIKEDGLKGITSNPTIFQKAIERGKEYDNGLHDLLAKNVSNPKELYLGLTTADVHLAADIMWPVHEQTRGVDGFVSIEVSPDLAYETEATIREARQLSSMVGKKNIFVKVPGTKEGLAAIEELISEGINVNVTLLFSVKRYEEVMDAYMKGLERRTSAGQPVNEINSVASFFVSRVDTLVDSLLDRLYEEGDIPEKEAIKDMYGKAAAANARMAYRLYKQTFAGERWRKLAEKGARVQRILWASTSTKNPAYSDIKYVEELIAPDSINTMPEETMQAFKDHGRVEVRISEGLEEVKKLMEDLKNLGIDMDEVTDELERDGVKKFSDSFFNVLDAIAQKRDAFMIMKSR